MVRIRVEHDLEEQHCSDPPNAGRMDFVIIGWMEKSRVELQPMVM